MTALLRFSRVLLTCLAVLAAGVPATASAAITDPVVQVDRRKEVVSRERTALRAELLQRAEPVEPRAHASHVVVAKRFLLNRALLR